MSVGPENSVITERLLAATATKTSRYIQNFYCYQPNGASQMMYRPSQRKHIVQESNKNRVFTDIWA
ncbi:hypothetical protein CKK19_12745 [Enterobacter sp. CCUG 70166]|nr:hypothetical protein [Enterobacter sp. CCUG 70166]